jgi:arginyl-tRNA synthetase
MDKESLSDITESILSSLLDNIHHVLQKEYNFTGMIHLAWIDLIPKVGGVAHLSLPCFELSKILKKPAQEIAANLADHLIIKGTIIQSAQADRGFLNIKLAPEQFIVDICDRIIDLGNTYGVKEKNHTKVMVEYSSPNTNKPQHLGHVRNNVLGQALVHILRNEGYDVIAANLINDRGIHICKSMLAYMKWGNGETPALRGQKGDHFVGEWYMLFEKKLKEEFEQYKKTHTEENSCTFEEFFAKSSLGQEAQQLLQKWERGDPETIRLWQQMNQWVYEGFNQTYEQLGCVFDKKYYESDTYKLGKNIIEEGLKKGVFTKREDGAVICNLEEYGLGQKIVLRPDGTSVYITQDLGTAQLKYDDYHLDQSIYVVANEQIHHFKVLFKILELLGYEWAQGCYHFAYGMVNLPEGKMKSREGTVVDADNLIAEMVHYAEQEIKTRYPNLSDYETRNRALSIAIAAIKYFLIKVNPQSTITFNPKEAISFEGQTGPYIQYTHARIQSILKKANIPFNTQKEKNVAILTSDKEMDIALELSYYPEILHQAAEQKNPSILAHELWKLAKYFNQMYQSLSILNAETDEIRTARLNLLRSIAIVLSNGLHILGIEAPDEM